MDAVVPGAGVSLSSDFALAPELSYNVGGRFDAPTRGGGAVSMMLDWSFKEEQQTSPQDSTTLTLPDHALLNLRLKYTNADGSWDASIYCSNCADEEYIFGGSAWGATTANTIYPYKPLDHPAFVSGGISPFYRRSGYFVRSRGCTAHVGHRLQVQLLASSGYRLRARGCFAHVGRPTSGSTFSAN